MKKYRSNIEWDKIIENWKDSALSKAQFCREKNISNSCFYNHLIRIDKKSTTNKLLVAKVVHNKQSINTLNCTISLKNGSQISLTNISAAFVKDLMD
jgi:hypothetical protein